MAGKKGPLWSSEDEVTLVLRGRGLAQWPEGLDRLQRLEQLHLDDNQLTDLSEQLARLPALGTLSLAGNPLEELADAVVSRLGRLTGLDLSRTPLQQLPESIAGCRLTRLRLEAMHRLDWDHAFTLLARIRTLATLSLGGNHLERLPSGLFQLTSLRVHHLHDCDLVEVSAAVAALKKLETLSLRNNQLESVPDELAAMPSRGSLVVSRNPGTRRIKARFKKLGAKMQLS